MLLGDASKVRQKLGWKPKTSFAEVAPKVVTLPDQPTAHIRRVFQQPVRPDGTPRKLLVVSRLAKLGWRARTSLEEGIRLA